MPHAASSSSPATFPGEEDTSVAGLHGRPQSNRTVGTVRTWQDGSPRAWGHVRWKYLFNGNIDGCWPGT